MAPIQWYTPNYFERIRRGNPEKLWKLVREEGLKRKIEKKTIETERTSNINDVYNLMKEPVYNPEKHYLVYGDGKILRIFDYETEREKILREANNWINCIYPTTINGNKGFLVGGSFTELYDSNGNLIVKGEEDKRMLAFIDPNNPKNDKVIKETYDWINCIYPIPKDLYSKF
jgi:hypothetical protein